MSNCPSCGKFIDLGTAIGKCNECLMKPMVSYEMPLNSITNNQLWQQKLAALERELATERNNLARYKDTLNTVWRERDALKTECYKLEAKWKGAEAENERLKILSEYDPKTAYTVIPNKAADKMIVELKSQLATAREALEKIADRWFDPKTRGFCVADCQANCNSKHDAPHSEYCPFEIAKAALDKIGKGTK